MNERSQIQVNIQVKRRIEVKCDKLFIDTCSAFTAYAVGDQAIVIAFRGTMIGTQMIIESEQTVFAHKVRRCCTLCDSCAGTMGSWRSRLEILR